MIDRGRSLPTWFSNKRWRSIEASEERFHLDGIRRTPHSPTRLPRSQLISRQPLRHICTALASKCRPPCRFRQLYVSSDDTDRRPRHAAFHQLFSPAAFPAACSRGGQPRVRSFADQVTLELRERPKDMEHELAARCGRINGFGDALKSDPLGLQLGHQFDQVLERSAHPVEPPSSTDTSRTFRVRMKYSGVQ